MKLEYAGGWEEALKGFAEDAEADAKGLPNALVVPPNDVGAARVPKAGGGGKEGEDDAPKAPDVGADDWPKAAKPPADCDGLDWPNADCRDV